MLSIIAIVGRVIQCVFSIVVLDLAANAIAAQVIPPAPTTPKYVDFVGAFGIIVAIVGVISLYVQRLSPKISIGLDTLAALFFLSAGIAWAVGLKGISCGNVDDAQKAFDNDLLNLGSIQIDGKTIYGVYDNVDNFNDAFAKVTDNCKKSFGNEILNFVAFAWTLALLGLDFVLMRKGGSSGATYV